MPVTGAWREGDPPGHRQFFRYPGDLALEGGQVLPGFTLAFETWGELNADASNAIWIGHPFSADSHVAGEACGAHPTPGWWDGVVGPGRAIDTSRYFVVATNILGGCQGSTGPSSPAPDGAPWGSRFPRLSLRDTVAADVLLADAMGIHRWAAVIGCSMGGCRALEWAITHPGRVASILAVGCTAYTTAEMIAQGHNQIKAVTDDPGWHGGDYYHLPPGHGPHRGLSLARQIAYLSYRGSNEMSRRFGRRSQGEAHPVAGGEFAMESFLDHQGQKLARRFDAGSYVTLTRVRNSHDIGRGRCGVKAALSRITARTTVVGMAGDLVYPPEVTTELAEGIANCGPVEEIASSCGHDGFLVDTDHVGQVIKRFLGG
ncbi:homoserine O-acetyltransferase [Streptomyces sioyaensis]|uniref:homoserine O-acetyltransferase MetX n=1 Tax=Streptomyces sioyaensis TaxID=67364 RepID=UPI0036826FD2